MSQEQLGAAAGLSKNTVQNAELDKHQPHAANALKMARAMNFQTWEEVIASVVKPSRPNGHAGMIPVLSEIPAGWDGESPIETAFGYEEAVDYLPPLPGVDDARAFGMKVKGDSMMPIYNEGDTVVASPTEWIQNGFEDGRRYVIRFNSDFDFESTVKRVQRVNDNEIDLIPENPKHPTRRVRDNQVALAGLVKGKYVAE